MVDTLTFSRYANICRLSLEEEDRNEHDGRPTGYSLAVTDIRSIVHYQPYFVDSTIATIKGGIGNVI